MSPRHPRDARVRVGRPTLSVEPDEAGSPRDGAEADRRERLARAVAEIDQALLRLARQGSNRLSSATVGELGALGQIAHLAGMARAEREIAALATWVQRGLERDPLFDERRALAAVHRVWLANHAARAALASGVDPAEATDRLGELRRRYEAVPDGLIVQALGASGWKTDSDFVGVTVALRAGDGSLLEIANARPAMHFGDDPRRLYRMPLSDALGLSAQDLAHGAFRFDGAKRSRDGRLSIHAGLRVRPAVWSGSAWDGLAASGWDRLVERLREEVDPLGAERAVWALVEPVGWGPFELDEAHNVARVALTDRRGARLIARVAVRRENALWVDNLQRLARSAALRPPALFGRVTAVGGLAIAPWTAVYGAPVRLRGTPVREVDEVHLGLEDLDRVQR